MLDHPGWRQGDTAAIARNFARLQFNIMYPQTTYNGPPPNYVELELQIVPFLAAIALQDRSAFTRSSGGLITLAFSLATVVTLAYFGRWLFDSAVAGLAAAFFFAVFPGQRLLRANVHARLRDGLLSTAALYAVARLLVEDARLDARALALRRPLLLTLAYLAKPVAVLAIVPVSAVLV